MLRAISYVLTFSGGAVFGIAFLCLLQAVYKEGEAYKVTVFRRSGLRRKLKPETYLLQEENGNLFMNTGFRIDVSYNEVTDVLTFSPNGDYVRVKPQPENPIEKQD